MILHLLLILVTLGAAEETPQTTETVEAPPIQKILTLTPESIDQAIQKHPFIMVEIYAAWCAPCKEFMPEYERLNERVQNEGLNVRIAKYDAVRDSQGYALQKFKISSFPTFLFFIEGRAFIFDQNRVVDNMITWMKQLINSPNPQEIITDAQLQQVLKENELVLLYQWSDTSVQNYWTFLELSKTHAGVTYIYSNLFKVGKPGSLWLYSNGEKKAFTQAFTKSNIKRFILLNQLPLVPRLDEQSKTLVYGSVPSFILFTGVDDVSQRAEKAFFEAANLFKKTYQFSYSRITDEKFFEELQELGADDGVFPKIIVFNQGEKFKYNGPEFTSKAIKGVIFDFRQGNLQKYLKSEPIPETSSGYVQKIVGYNFEEAILKSPDTVLVEFYADWCGACQSFKSTYEQIGYELRNEKIVVAAVNAPNNEIFQFYRPKSYPDIVLFKAGMKQYPIQFVNDERNLTTVLEFVRNNTMTVQQQ